MRHRVVLLGEMHDNPHHHRLRAEALATALATDPSSRPALLMEQFDRERQADIERARRERPRDAAYLIAQATPERSAWNWVFYRPFVALALQYDLPLIAVNVSRADAQRVVREGIAAAFSSAELARLELHAPLPPAVVAAIEEAVRVGHCDALPRTLLPAMARAQMARDAAMALALHDRGATGAVLIAGNGHVRRDFGVPVWLARLGAKPAWVVGFTEAGTIEAAGAYDRQIATEAHVRPDPCAEFRRRNGAASGG
ncbi:MAG: ChaN family lipoprotein [Burkholderiales bacterium]|nr:ChaN family lipoprotein [Burkholderiales bacterium]